MDAQTKKLKNLIKLMRKEGVLGLKCADFEISLSPGALFPEHREASAKEFVEGPSTIPSYTPEQILNWSAPGFTEVNEESVN